MKNIPPPAEWIRISDWPELCSGLPNFVCTHTEHAYDHVLSNLHTKKYVMVTYGSDVSIREQDLHHPNADLEKTAFCMNLPAWADKRDRYYHAQVGPTCDTSKCRASDRFVGKMERFAFWTLNEIPENITVWYSTNLDVKHPRMRWLPYGLNDDGHGADILPNYAGREKTKLTYANFSPHTVERLGLRHWCSLTPWITYRHEQNLPVEKYLEELAEHKFVLCPEGNGLDCYRTYETLYLGGIPIMQESTFSRFLFEANLPVVLVKDFRYLTKEVLEEVYSQMMRVPFNYEVLTKSYWRKTFAGHVNDA